MAMRPVHRIKHVVDNAATLDGALQLNFPVITTVDAPVLANTTEVETGAKVNGIYLKVEVGSNETIASAISNCYLIVWKSPANALSTVPAANAVGSEDTKRFVIHQEMVMLNGPAAGNPRVLFNGVIVIPKGYRRFGPDDKLFVSILSPVINIILCIQCHYKEFR